MTSTKVLDATSAEIVRLLARRKLELYRPYPKQMQFHADQARERLLMAASQSGKTWCAAAETAMHLTGRYPEGWAGKRFDKPVRGMAASETSKLTRDGVQVHLCGWPATEKGTGMIPASDIIETPAAQGTADAFDYLRVKYISGGESICYLRSYDQGRERVQAMTLDFVWLDEEPELDYYTECLTRTNTTLGLVYLTFTPIKGITDVVQRFLGKHPGTSITNMTLEDAEHYTPEQRTVIMAQYQDHERDARIKGLPMLGSGKVFPIAEEIITIQAFPLPDHWPRIVGVDFGWDHPTTAVWIAWDRDTDTVYVTDTHRVSQATPIIHAATITAKGKWIPAAWPHDGLQHDKGSGEQLAEQYRKLGVNMLKNRATFPDGTNGLEAGVMEMLQRMQTGRWKVFSHLLDWFEEFRMYHRKKGLIVKDREDLLSASRYGMMELRHAVVKEPPKRLNYAFTPLDPDMGY